MKLRQIFSTAFLCGLSACSFFEAPLEDPGTVATPATGELSPPPPPPPPPPLPSPSQSNQVASAPASSDGTYLIVSTIFEVPETAPNLSFVHFTDRNGRRETAICEALLNLHSITRPADVPTTARTIIVWPIVEGETADNCRSMVQSHEPLDVSSQTAAIVNSDGPYLMTRNDPQQKQMIYDLSSVRTGDLASSLTQWQQTLAADVQSWPPVVKAR